MVEVLLLLFFINNMFFVLAALLLLVVLVLLTTSVLKQREVPATDSFFYVSVLYTAMLRTSIAAVVLGSFYFSLLDCDASVIVVDGAAVETGCLLEKYIKCYSPSPLLPFSFVSVAAVEKGYAFLFFGRGASAADHFSCWLRCCWRCLCCLQHQY